MAHVGEVKIFAFNYVPENYLPGDGKRLAKKDYSRLYGVLGETFTKENNDDSTFAILDLRNRFVNHTDSDIRLGKKNAYKEVTLMLDQMPEHNHEVGLEVDNTTRGYETFPLPNPTNLNNASVFNGDAYLGGVSLKNVGKPKPIPIKNAQVKIVYVIRYQYNDPTSGFLDEIKFWPNSKTDRIYRVPKGWKLCVANNYSISNNSALGSIIGFKYGETSYGKPKFPDFRKKCATGAQEINKAAKTGWKTSICLGLNNLPSHKHDVKLAVNNSFESENLQIPINTFININAESYSTKESENSFLTGINKHSFTRETEPYYSQSVFKKSITLSLLMEFFHLNRSEYLNHKLL